MNPHKSRRGGAASGGGEEGGQGYEGGPTDECLPGLKCSVVSTLYLFVLIESYKEKNNNLGWQRNFKKQGY